MPQSCILDIERNKQLRKLSILVFLLISAIALIVLLYDYRTPQTNRESLEKCELKTEPEKNNEEWNRIAVTCTSNGQLSIDDQPVDTGAGVDFENKLRARESELRKKLPEPYRTMKKSNVAVSLDMEPGTTLDIFFDSNAPAPPIAAK